MAQTISKLADELGVRPDTIRYYEKIGILPEPERTPSGYRQYDATALDRLRFVKGAQRLGLRLEEIRELLDIRDTGMCPCGHTSTLLHRRIAAVDEELGRLTTLRAELAGMVEKWPAEADKSPDGKMWHCAGEVIPIPDDLSGWLCGDDCRPASDEKQLNPTRR